MSGNFKPVVGTECLYLHEDGSWWRCIPTYIYNEIICINLLQKKSGQVVVEKCIYKDDRPNLKGVIPKDQLEMITICNSAGSGNEQRGEMLYAAGFRKVESHELSIEISDDRPTCITINGTEVNFKCRGLALNICDYLTEMENTL